MEYDTWFVSFVSSKDSPSCVEFKWTTLNNGTFLVRNSNVSKVMDDAAPTLRFTNYQWFEFLRLVRVKHIFQTLPDGGTRFCDLDYELDDVTLTIHRDGDIYTWSLSGQTDVLTFTKLETEAFIKQVHLDPSIDPWAIAEDLQPA